jgi:hypothetical protein
MKFAIAGVAPRNLGEATVMTVWPSMAAWPIGRWLGRRYRSQLGFGPILTLGNLFAVLFIPVSLAIFAIRLAPFICTFYRLTNRRVVVFRVAVRGLKLVFREERAITLDRFDRIEIEVLSGQEWYPAGDLVFKLGPVETFRLQGVLRPESFRHTCLKARQSYAGVEAALAH